VNSEKKEKGVSGIGGRESRKDLGPYTHGRGFGLMRGNLEIRGSAKGIVLSNPIIEGGGEINVTGKRLDLQ